MVSIAEKVERSTRNMFVANEGAKTFRKEVMQNLILNLAPGAVRTEMLEGRKHLVAPIAMLTKGVHTGSAGPGFYDEPDMKATVGVWDHKPIVVYHPEINGKPVSACKSSVLEKQKIGIILESKYDNKLRCEGWFDYEKTEKVDKRVLEALESGRMMEVSTGLFVDAEETEGTWNAEAYEWIARNLKPDHLAILPDKIGACSIKDGAGLLQLNHSKVQAAVKNEMSHSNIAMQLGTMLRSQMPMTQDQFGTYIQDVYDAFFIYSQDGKLYKQKYNAAGNEVVFVGEPAEVERVTEYRTLDGAVVGNVQSKPQEKETTQMAGNKLKVDALITNGGFAESDRTYLMSLEDARLDAFAQKMRAEPVANSGNTITQQLAQTTTTPPAPVLPPKLTAMQEFLNNAPPEFRSPLKAMVENHNATVQSLITKIKASPRNKFTDPQLIAMAENDVSQLRALADLIDPLPAEVNNGGGFPPSLADQIPVPNYFGAQGFSPTPVVDNSAPVVNEADDGPLLAPTMTFEETKKK